LTKALALALVLLATPAAATEIIANASSVDVFAQAAQQTGFIIPDGKGGQTMKTVGTLSGSLGAWFFNYAGQVVDIPAVIDPKSMTVVTPATYLSGVWARVRINGTPDIDFVNFLKTVAGLGVTIYQQIQAKDGSYCWSSDGATCSASPSQDKINSIAVIM
jgi:hypothetical protein